MGKQDDEWLDDSVDESAFERTLEGQTILGTGGPLEKDEVIYLSESEDD
ncbi:hypothetical protein [Microbacterium sp. HSID17254]|nr:hypothetical protein [Microbacterium sp. HSID17254]